jgi:hypothetical protein
MNYNHNFAIELNHELLFYKYFDFPNLLEFQIFHTYIIKIYINLEKYFLRNIYKVYFGLFFYFIN